MDMEDIRMVLHQLCHFTGIVDGEARALGQLAGHSQLNQKVLARRLVNGVTALVQEPQAVLQALGAVFVLPLVGAQAQEAAEQAHVIGHMKHAHIIADAL